MDGLNVEHRWVASSRLKLPEILKVLCLDNISTRFIVVLKLDIFFVIVRNMNFITLQVILVNFLKQYFFLCRYIFY